MNTPTFTSPFDYDDILLQGDFSEDELPALNELWAIMVTGAAPVDLITMCSVPDRNQALYKKLFRLITGCDSSDPTKQLQTPIRTSPSKLVH